MVQETVVNDELEQSVATMKAAQLQLEDSLQRKEDEMQLRRQKEALEGERLEAQLSKAKAEAQQREVLLRRRHGETLQELQDAQHETLLRLKAKLQRLRLSLPLLKAKVQSMSDALGRSSMKAMRTELQAELTQMGHTILSKISCFLRLGAT